MVVLLKIGGSLITDKKQEKFYRADVMKRIASEVRQALDEKPDLKLVIGHGSGSFGHFVAKRHNTIQGVRTPEEWCGFAEVAQVAAELNAHVSQAFWDVGVPVWRLQPSASAIAHDGVVRHMALQPIQVALEHGLVPLVYGDVALDEVRGGTILSTETIFTYLAEQLDVERIVLLGEVDGVYDETGMIVDMITPERFEAMKSAFQGASGVDVTGGMMEKVRLMLRLSRDFSLTTRIVNGLTPKLVYEALIDSTATGTLICASANYPPTN